jgi:hypothetical protein
VARAAFSAIAVPFFSITGTEDLAPALHDVSPEERTWPHRYMPDGRKYLLVLEGAVHSDFGGGGRPARARPAGRRLRAGRGAPEAPDPHVVEAVTAATAAFWKATLLDDEEARSFLEDGGVRALLAAGDRYEMK